GTPPRQAICSRDPAVVHDPAVGRPREPPAVPQVVARLPFVGAITSRLRETRRVDPAAAGGRSVGFQLAEAGYERVVGGAAAVDLLQYLFDDRFVVRRFG